jgi:hypothetical protein
LFERWGRTGKLDAFDRHQFAATQFVDLVVATPRNKAVIGTPPKRPSLDAHVACAVDLFFRGYGPNND